MKPQDIVFLLIIAFVVFKKSPKIAVGLGIVCLFLAIPLFAKWIFFTAERLTWYAAAFFLLGIVLLFFRRD